MKIARKHPTKRIIVKTALIDKGMIPVIEWLNRYESVITKWCCQGSNHPVDCPYVVFACDSPYDLLTIVEKVGYTGVVEIRPSLGIRMMDYCIRFPNKRNFNMFKKGL